MYKMFLSDKLIEEMRAFKSQKDVEKFIKKNRSIEHLPMALMDYAAELWSNNNYESAMMIYMEMDGNKHLPYVYDDVTLGLRLGKYYIENGEIEKGKTYLLNICNEYSNYEESFSFRELTDEWLKVKPYVADQIPASLITMGDEAEAIDNASMTDDELLELLLEEIGSGGVHSYLTSYGHRLEETLAAAEHNGKTITVEFLKMIKTKYFGGKMPEKLEKINEIIFENDWWFEEEFDQYYSHIEDELA